MTLPTKTLLRQLRGEVGWMRLQIEYIPGCGGTDAVHDHEAAALDIIEELEGRDGDRLWNKTFIMEDLRRLHDLIKACADGHASREAMELIRGMIGEK